MDIKPAARRVTVYVRGMMGNIQRIEASAFSAEVGKCAQYSSAVHFAFIPKGKRNVRSSVETSRPSLLVLDGWGHPAPDSMFLPEEPTADPEVSIQRGRYRSCDSRWQSDFDTMIDAYVAQSGAKVVSDYRRHDTC